MDLVNMGVGVPGLKKTESFGKINLCMYILSWYIPIPNLK
jgi:hypothetical protein